MFINITVQSIKMFLSKIYYHDVTNNDRGNDKL